LPDLSERLILRWADAHHRRTSRWPTEESGPLPDAPGEVWGNIDMALRAGGRGLPGGSSLPRLLEEKRGVRNRARLDRLTVPRILAWADAHHRRTGRWPSYDSGPIADAPGETWRAVHSALR